MSGRVRLSHRLEYAGFKLLSAGALGLAERRADRVGAALGRTIARLGIRADVVLDNLRHAFPEKDEAWIARVARGSWEHLGREAVSILRLPAIPPAEWLARVRYPEEEVAALRAAVARGRGAVIVTGHFGSVEAAALTVTALGIPLCAYFQRLTNPLVDAEVERVRAALGIRLIDRRLGVRPGVEALQRGEAVAVVADQDARTHGVFVPFFGRPASTHRGAAIMALRAQAPIFFGYARREGAGYLGGVRELEVTRQGETDDVVRRIIAAFTAQLEAVARTAPEQYFWQHRRWKSSPSPVPEEPVESAAV